jgi:DNA-binding transcriptional regulator GbsR (MarR family)
MASTRNRVPLPAAAQKFILHWGEMAARWGLQRAVAQVYALLYVSPQPLNAEQITKALHLARSTVSTAIRDLESVGLIRNSTVLGDRRAQFACSGSPREALCRVLLGSKIRQVDASISILQECISVAEQGTPTDRVLEDRFASLMEAFEALSSGTDVLIESLARSAPSRRKR